MAQITSREELEEWLKNKPADWGQVIAARAALRALPYAFGADESEDWVVNHSLSIFRAAIIPWFLAISDHKAQNVNYDGMAGNAAKSSEARANYAAQAVAYSALTTALTNTDKIIEFSVETCETAARAAASYADYGGDEIAFADVWRSIESDCKKLTSWNNDLDYQNHNIRRLMIGPLWLSAIPMNWDDCWQTAKMRLCLYDNFLNYGVWVYWFRGRVSGDPKAFGIPGDSDRTEDKAILARLADAKDEDFWDKGATYVNTTLQGWIDEARERVRHSETPDEPPSPTPEAIRAIAAEIASPSVTLTNNQLDVIANTTFDGQSDTANLDEAIAVLRAVVGALLGGLPGNAPRSFAANLTIYDSELAKRDAKPFLGVLVRMEKSVSAGFYADPEMFDAGVTTNFESYFEAHLAFMTHYRRNEEREAKIAQFTIDDAAASGVALTGPVDEVVKEVDALAEQGLVTDGFVQAIKEQQAINYEVALYTSSMPTISGEPSVKKRLILQIVGILERALAVVNNLVSATAQYGAFVKVVKQAIAELLKFFI